MSVDIIKLVPNIRDEENEAVQGYIWGKEKNISNILKTLPQHMHSNIKGIVAERWICSDDSKWPSYTTDGQSLRELLSQKGREILGAGHYEVFGPHLATVMKLLDTSPDPARGTLSIQVHPHEGHETRPPKPEMWEAVEGSVYFGLKKSYSEEEILHAAHNGTIDHMLWRVSFEKGDLLEAPGGMIHALRYGGFYKEWSMAEHKSEQKKSLSDATLALSDRGDAKLVARPGKEQPEEALEVIKDAGMLKAIDPKDFVTKPVTLTNKINYTHFRLFDTKYAVIDKYELRGPCTISLHERGMPSYVEGGSIDVFHEQRKMTTYHEGEEAILPHYLKEVTFVPTSSSATLYVWYAPLT